MTIETIMDLLRAFVWGRMAIAVWFMMAAVFFFLAFYTWLIVLKVRGIHGVALATVFGALGVITSCFGWLLVKPPIATIWFGIVITAMFWPLLWSCVILADLYSARHNTRGSFTARSYSWWRRVIHAEEGSGL